MLAGLLEVTLSAPYIAGNSFKHRDPVMPAFTIQGHGGLWELRICKTAYCHNVGTTIYPVNIGTALRTEVKLDLQTKISGSPVDTEFTFKHNTRFFKHRSEVEC